MKINFFHNKKLLQIAKEYVDAGLSTIPVRTNKKPDLPKELNEGKWVQFQTRRPSESEIEILFNRDNVSGIAVICGKVSGSLEVIDFDDHGSRFTAWKEKISLQLYNRLMVERSQSGGYHVYYRCTEIGRDDKLALTVDKKVLIETRSEGGYIVCAPTPGYELVQGNFHNIPVITPAERQILIDAAEGFDETPPPPPSKPKPKPKPDRSAFTGESPADAYNRSGDVRMLLEKHGWKFEFTATDGNEHWTRPGKVGGTSATLKELDGLVPILKNFSTNAGLETDKGYSPFQLYAELEHGGDQSAAAKELYNQGYGRHERKLEAEVGGDKPKKLRLRTITAKDLVHKELPPKKMLLSPWLREGTLAIVSAPTGVGKSWFSLTVAKAVSEGTNAFDDRWKASEASRVLYIDGEMEDVDIQERLNILGIENENFILHTIETDTDDVLQINVGQLEWQEVIIDEIKELRISLLILDNVFTLYDTGEKSNTQEYWKLMQSFILKLRAIGVAVLLVDHEGKNREIKSAMGTAAKAFVLNATFTLSHPDDYQMEEGARFNVEMGKARNLKGRDTVPFIATLQDDGKWDTVDKSELDAQARDRYSEELDRIREDFRAGLIPVQIQSNVIKQGDIAKLYNMEMPEIIRSEFNNDWEPLSLEEALKKYEPSMVRLAYMLNHTHRQGDACVELIEAGQAEADVLKTYRAINGKVSDRPAEVVRYSKEQQQKAEAELRRKYYILLYQGKAKEYFDGDKELKKFSFKSMRQDLTRSYFTEKNAELIPLALRQGDERPPLCLVWLRNEASGGYYPCEPNFDETEMCRIYVETARDESQKKRRLETLRMLRRDDSWKKTIGRLAKVYEIKLDPKQVGRPKKSRQTSSDEKDSEKES